MCLLAATRTSNLFARAMEDGIMRCGIPSALVNRLSILSLLRLLDATGREKCKQQYVFRDFYLFNIMSGTLILLSLPTTDTILHNSRFLFKHKCVTSCNRM